MVKIIYLIFIIGVLLTAASANDGFIVDSIDVAHRLSKETGKPALIIFGADYCKFCNSLKQDILDNKLSPKIDRYIICYADIKENPDIKERYDVSMIPDSRIFVENKEISKIKGYSKNNYIKWLNNND